MTNYFPNSTFDQILRDMSMRTSKNNVEMLRTMASGEGMPLSTNNPLATTMPMHGSFAINSVGVQQYPNRQEGEAATAATFLNGDYPGLVAGLSSNAPMSYYANNPSAIAGLRTWQGTPPGKPNEDVQLFGGGGDSKSATATANGGGGSIDLNPINWIGGVINTVNPASWVSGLVSSVEDFILSMFIGIAGLVIVIFGVWMLFKSHSKPNINNPNVIPSAGPSMMDRAKSLGKKGATAAAVAA